MTPEHDASSALVLRVNELFHDMEGAAYADVHPEIFDAELERWDALLAKRLADLPRPLRCVDVGCGTGFVSERLFAHLRAGDSLVLADISDVMLGICRDRFATNDKGVTVTTFKMSDETLALPDASADVVLLNSVLHHVPDASKFLAELTRVLAPGGVLMIGHEPNIRFWRSAFLPANYAILRALAPKRIAAATLKKLGLYGAMVRAKPDPFLDDLNKKLLGEKLIDAPLSRADVSRLVDVHSPTAGGVRRDEGFDPYAMFDALPMRDVAVETYSHLSKLSDKPALRWYDRVLRALLPRSGAIFFVSAKRA
jgi:SAM-dependent methyltransferase